MVSPDGRLPRREHLAGSALAAGYAVAVRPIAAETMLDWLRRHGAA